MRLFLPILLSFACEKETHLLVQIPFEAQHRSAVVAVEHRGEASIYSVDAEKRDEKPILRSIEGWDQEDPITLRVSRYEETLDAMGLPGPGPIFSASFGRKLGVRTVLERTLDERGLGEWTTSDHWPGVFADFRFGDPCRTIGASWRMPLPSDVVAFAGLIPRPDGSAIFVGRTIFERPVFFRITTEGYQRLAVAADFRGPYAFLGNDDRIWLMGGEVNATLYAGDPETGFRTVSVRNSTDGSWPHWSAMTKGGVVFAIAPSGELYRIEGDDWQVVHRFPVTEFNDQAVLSIIGEEELYVIDPDAYALHHYNNGTVVTEPTEIDGALSSKSDRFLTVKYVEGVGSFAASDEGYVLERGADGRWRIIQEPLIIGREVWTIEEIAGGILVGGFYGVLDQYYPETGFCEEARFRYGNDLALNVLALIDGGIAVAGFRLVSQGVREYFIAALTVE